MVKRINYSKILIVTFLTVLIWVWADLALDEEFSVSGATIQIAKFIDPALWVSFDEESSVPIKNIVLRGSASKITEVKQKLNEGSLALEFFLNPEQSALIEHGKHTLNVLDFLKQSDQVRQLGLTVVSCEPATLSVNVVSLVKKSLAVKCFDDAKNPVETATMEPQQVDMFVPADWMGEKLIAKVQLTRREIGQAGLSAVEKKPYINFTASQTREAPANVKITMPPEEDSLGDYTITTATLGFSLSANLQGKYSVEVINLNEVIRAITIRATPDAKRAYEKMRYQVILEIEDSDKDTNPSETKRRELIYNFPQEYVRKDEIKLNQQPVTAQFKLVPLPPSNQTQTP